MTVDPRHLTITDLLLGAVHADERLEGEEEDAVRKLMRELIGEDELPLQIEARIANFEPKEFDLQASVEDFAADPAIKKRKLLEIVAAVFDADGEVDFDEDEYLRDLAKALGMEESEYSDLAIHYEIEDASAALDVVVDTD